MDNNNNNNTTTKETCYTSNPEFFTRKRKRPINIIIQKSSEIEQTKQLSIDNNHKSNLEDLWTDGRCCCRCCCLNPNPNNNSSDRCCQKASSSSSPSSSSFFSFRMEHRVMNNNCHLSFDGIEERLLIFRSDIPGAIGKIIFSSRWVSTTTTTTTNERPRRQQQQQQHPDVIGKIHVLSVKEAYRGCKFGELLFTTAMDCLKRRCVYDVPNNNDSSDTIMIRVMFDAEEDIRRHNNLVQFYQKLGCFIKDNAKIIFMNNNDGEVYRRIPMQINLTVQPSHVTEEWTTKDTTIMTTMTNTFLPLSLVGETRNQLFLDGKQINLIITQSECCGSIQIHTTQRDTLTSDQDGRCFLIPVDQAQPSDNFCLIRASESYANNIDERSNVIENELWMLQSAKNGLFLDSDGHKLLYSKKPSFWEVCNSQMSSSISLVKSNDNPLKRYHIHRMRSKQTLEYVQSMRDRYLCFKLDFMTLKAALDAAKELPADHFSFGNNTTQCRPVPSLCTLMFTTAELSRSEGHPDWFQLISMIYGLAVVLKLSSTNSNSSFDYDWAVIGNESHVIRCNPTNPSSPILDENIMLSWSSCEYMFYLLKHNKVLVPDEAYTILKYQPLVEWHSRGGYSFLSNGKDEYSKCTVADFSDLCEQARLHISNGNEILSEEECLRLWDTHYSFVFQKYGADHALEW